MNPLFFTLCSNNYLAFAITLGKSVKQFLPEARFIIGLVDTLDPKIDYEPLREFEFLPCLELGYPEFDDMLSRYNIIEFNTAVKPFYLEYLFRENPKVDEVFYFDPDLVFYQTPELLSKEFGEAEILLTPNLLYTQLQPTTGELTSLRHGMYNLGFIGLKRGTESLRLIQWWKERLRDHCRIDKCRGIFVDQKWIDLAPLFFDRIKIMKHSGWNMAWWNFSERTLLEVPINYAVNQPETPLIFFHFSGFKPGKDGLTERLISEEFAISADTPLARLYKDYEDRLLANDFVRLSQFKPGLEFYKPPSSTWNQAGRKIKSKVTNLIYRIFKV